MNRKHERRWGSQIDRARVAAELLAEAESLTRATDATPVEASAAAEEPVAYSPTPPPAPARTADEAPARAAAPVRPTDPDLTLAALDTALESAPDDAALLLRRAELACTARRYGAAQCDLERILQTDPGHTAALTALGVVLSRKGLWSRAVPYFRRAVTFDPGRGQTWFYLGEALNHMDDLEGALAAFERATDLQPSHARALHGLGVVLDRMNRPADATRMYRRSREAAGR